MAAIGTVAVLFVMGDRPAPDGARSGPAPAFTLASTSGAEVSLEDLRSGSTLLYFNEGVGCDACFAQMVELEQNADRLAAAGIEVVPIVVNPVEVVVPELQRFGITTPYLIDGDAEVSRAYGMLGRGMHAGLPGHGFVLVDASGEIRWAQEYPSMFVSAEELLSSLPPTR